LSLKNLVPESLMRSELKNLKPYQSHVIPGNIKLDANENPFPWPAGMREELLSQNVFFNRYPDGEAKKLRESLARYTKIPKEGILTGNGSDELIQVILATFGGPGKELLIHPPTFSMYAAAAKVTGTGVLEVPLITCSGLNFQSDLRLDTEQILAKAQDDKVNVIIICNPNNPTGSLFDRGEILKIVRESEKIVIVDEAYSEFAGESLVNEVKNYSNLIVMRTFSKAFGMAGLRLGYIMAQEGTINLINRVRQPFNVNGFTQEAGVLALNYLSQYQHQIESIKEETQKLVAVLTSFPGIEVFSTRANFILFKPKEAGVWHQTLEGKGFTIRNMGDLPVVGKCLRVSAGLPEENNAFIQALKSL